MKTIVLAALILAGVPGDTVEVGPIDTWTEQGLENMARLREALWNHWVQRDEITVHFVGRDRHTGALGGSGSIAIDTDTFGKRILSSSGVVEDQHGERDVRVFYDEIRRVRHKPGSLEQEVIPDDVDLRGTEFHLLLLWNGDVLAEF